MQCTSGKLIETNKTYNQDDYLFWSDSRKLTWDDFKGVPEGSSNDYSSSISVSIPSSIDKQLFIAPTFTSVCVFDKRKSWVHKDVANDTLLLYNQTIFDIHEVYARKLRKAFMETTFMETTYKDQYKSITSDNNSNLLNRVEEFRRESFHGEKGKAILKWAAQINNELQELNQYRKDY
jgi:hypothetical protein